MDNDTLPQTKGRLIHSAAAYDLLVWLLTFGREDVLREKFLDLARVRAGERVLDIGCGTGSLAIAARQRVGAAGAVSGFDASPEMIERANRKAKNVRVDVDFRVAVVELMPFGDAAFDVVLSTLMIHHLPRAARETCMLEIARVLKPGGRALVVDLVRDQNVKGIMAYLHRHGGLVLEDIAGPMRAAQLQGMAAGPAGRLGLYYILARKA